MADWIAAGITTVASWFGATLSATGTIVTWTANMIVAVGQSFLMQALMGKKAGEQGAQFQISFNATQPRTAILWDYGTAGSLVTWVNDTYDEPNDRIFLFIALADHKCTLRGGLCNGERKTFDVELASTTGRAPIAEYIDDDDNEFGWITFRDGDWNQDADADLIALSGGRFTANDRGRGIAYVKLEFLQPSDPDWKRELFPQGQAAFFQWFFELRGYPCYDRRLDDEAGGTGDQRADDTSEWTPSGNVAVLIENVMRGLVVEDETADPGDRVRDVFYGLELGDDDIPFDEQITAMNACDELVDLRGGGTESRYLAAGQIDCSQPVESVLQDLQAAMAGSIVYGVGRWYCVAGVPRTPAYEDPILDSERRVDGVYSCADFTPLDQVVTSVTGNYTDAAQLFRQLDVPPRTSTAADEAIGGRRSINLSLPMVPSGTQAQRIMEIALRREQRQWREQIALPADYIGLEPTADWVTRTSPRYGTKTFEVQQAGLGVGDDDLLMVTLNLREIDDEVFAWDPDVDEGEGAGLGGDYLYLSTTPGPWEFETEEDYPDGLVIRLWGGGGTGSEGGYVKEGKDLIFVSGAGGGGGQWTELEIAGPVMSGTTYSGDVGTGGEFAVDGGDTTCDELSLTAHGGDGAAGTSPGAGGTGATGGDTDQDGRAGGLTSLTDGGGSGMGGGDQTAPNTQGTLPGGGGSASSGPGRPGAVRIHAA